MKSHPQATATIWRITHVVLSKSWDDSIFSESAQAALVRRLWSLPPATAGMCWAVWPLAPLFGGLARD